MDATYSHRVVDPYQHTLQQVWSQPVEGRANVYQVVYIFKPVRLRPLYNVIAVRDSLRDPTGTSCLDLSTMSHALHLSPGIGTQHDVDPDHNLGTHGPLLQHLGCMLHKSPYLNAMGLVIN